MPMNWNTEADAKLLSKIFQVCDVKVSGDQLKEIAAAFGSDCTPKAITHRITKFRNAAKDGDTKEEGKEDTPKPKVTKTRAAPKSRGKKSAAEIERTPSPDGDSEEAIPTPPATTTKRTGSKRSSKSADAEEKDDEETPSKKVKTEEDGEADAEGEEAEGVIA